MSNQKFTDLEQVLLEDRKVKALEKIASSLDGLALWFEEIDKEEWDERIQYYLAEFLKHQANQPKDGA